MLIVQLCLPPAAPPQAMRGNTSFIICASLFVKVQCENKLGPAEHQIPPRAQTNTHLKHFESEVLISLSSYLMFKCKLKLIKNRRRTQMLPQASLWSTRWMLHLALRRATGEPQRRNTHGPGFRTDSRAVTNSSASNSEITTAGSRNTLGFSPTPASSAGQDR